MTIRVRTVLALVAALAVIGLASCGHYTCGATFGASTCTGSGGGITSGGGGNGTPTFFAFHISELGAVDGYTLDATKGTFRSTANYTAPTIPVNLGSDGIVVAQKKYIYAAFPELQQIYGWSVDSLGILSPLSGTPLTVSLTMPSADYKQTVVLTNPAGTLLFISEAGASQILVYQINGSGGLSPAAGSPFSTPSFEPQNMAMDGLGRFLYVAQDAGNHSGTIVNGYTVSSSGVLQALPGNPINIPMFDMQGEATGNYLVGISGQTALSSGTDDDSLYVFRIDVAGGLTPVANSPFSTVSAPYNFSVQPTVTDQTVVYSLPFPDEAIPIEGYQLDTGTGQLSQVSGSPLGVNSTLWGNFDPSGNYYVLYNSDSHFGSLTSFSVGSSGSLTLGPEVTLASNGYWTLVEP